jgi:hypothetical protein
MNNKCNRNGNSYYNQRVGRPFCGVNNFYKVTVFNVQATNVVPESMSCGECECILESINDNNGNVTNICRREYGSIYSTAGLYIITTRKTQSQQ